MRFLNGQTTWTYCEGENDGNDDAAAAAAEAAAAQQAAEVEAKAKADAALAAKKTFTQDEVNKLLADDRRKHKAQVDKSVAELEQLKKSKSLSDQERHNLAQKIEDLQNSVLTKEQVAAKEQEKLKKTLEHTTKELTEDRDSWKNRFHTTQIQQAITSEAVTHQAFDPDALIALLETKTRLVEVIDDDGKATGQFVPKTKLQDKDKDGRVVTIEMTVPEAVAKMKEQPKYGYLFKSTAAAGLGAGTQGGGRGGEVDPSSMGTEQYRAWRKKEGINKV
jgi:hypothetical protein